MLRENVHTEIKIAGGKGYLLDTAHELLYTLKATSQCNLYPRSYIVHECKFSSGTDLSDAGGFCLVFCKGSRADTHPILFFAGVY